MSENSTGKTIKLKPLKSSEYRLWAVQAEATFRLYRCLDIVLGTSLKPDVDENGNFNRQQKRWETRHNLALEGLLKALEPVDLLKVLPVKDSAPAIWARLKDEYGKSLDFEYIRVNSEFQSLRKDSKMPMDDHINKFNMLLQAVNYNKPPEIPALAEAAVNLNFLQSLGADWEVWGMTKGNALRTTPTAELMAEVRALAMRGKTSGSDEPKTEANAARFGNRQESNSGKSGSGKWKKKRGNRGRGGQPYSKDKEGNNGGGKRSSVDPNKFCTFHQRQGHNIFECRDAKKQKDGSGSNPKGNGSDGSRQNKSEPQYEPNFTRPSYPYSSNTINHIANVIRFIEVNSTETSTTAPGDWLVDSAANAYITPFKSDLRFYVETEVGKVKGFAGTQTTVVGKGTMTLTDPAGNRITLNNVCYCPNSHDRILSLMKFRREHHADFQFTSLESFMLKAANGFEVHGRSINDILHVTLSSLSEINAVSTHRATHNALKRSNEHIDSVNSESESESDSTSDHETNADHESSTPPPTSPSSLLTCSPHELWHLRFGHAATTALRHLRLIKSSFDSRKCVICLRTKKTRTPFHLTEPKAYVKLERIHSDLSGPFSASVKLDTIYNLLFLDEATREVHTYDLKDKTSASITEKFKEYLAEVERETGLKVKRLHVDGGGEYRGDLTPILKSLGIKYEPTPPYTPESNGKAERMNRTLNSMVRAMLAQANMPNSFWAEAMKTATYLRNRLPNSALNNQIPHELWSGKRLQSQDFKQLKPFGCIVWDEIPKQHRKKQRLNKLADTGTRGCFLGYNSSTTYRYWSFQRKEVVHSGNLTFHETEFPQRSDFDDPDDEFQRPDGTLQWPPSQQAIHNDEDDEISVTDEAASDTSEHNSSHPTLPTVPPVVYDEITVQKPPTVLSIMFGPLADSTPKSFTDAMSRPDKQQWWDALVAEIKAVIQNQTWSLVDLPPGKRAIPLKWVFKVKHDAKGNFEKYKARIVVKGYSQVAGLDFNETFAPVVRVESVRVIFAIAAANGLYILHLDCKNAFLHGESDVEIYVLQPEGFKDKQWPHKVLYLNKSLYGLKQAPRIWYLFLCGVIINLGFITLESDPCIYIRG
jgi:hypothetical protein